MAETETNGWNRGSKNTLGLTGKIFKSRVEKGGGERMGEEATETGQRRWTSGDERENG